MRLNIKSCCQRDLQKRWTRREGSGSQVAQSTSTGLGNMAKEVAAVMRGEEKGQISFMAAILPAANFLRHLSCSTPSCRSALISRPEEMIVCAFVQDGIFLVGRRVRDSGLGWRH